jgi:hypothetical protein
MVAYGSHDAAALKQANQNLAVIGSQRSDLQQGYQAEEQKWQTARAKFICAMQVARQQHASLTMMPPDCRA